MSNGWFVEPDDLVDVTVPGCHCPGTPHTEEVFGLLPEPTPELGLAAVSALYNAAPNQMMKEVLGRVYLEHGVKRWTLVDENGKPVPITHELLRRIKWDAVLPIAEKGSELYSEAIFRPLVGQAPNSSPPGRIVPLTSAKPSSSRRRQTA